MTTNIESIEKLTQQSLTRSRELEKISFKIIEDTLSSQDEKFFIVTVDIHSDLFYAPLTNIDSNYLLELFGTEILLENIRNNFPVSMSETMFVSEIYKSLIQKDSFTNDVLVLQLDTVGIVTNTWGLTKDGKLIDVKKNIEETIRNNKQIDKVINSFIEDVKQRENKNSGYKYFILRPDYKVDIEHKSRQLELLQIGFFILNGELKAVLPDLAKTIFHAANISSYATLALFYEKERYFQKAIRQSVKGSIIKYGNYEDIKEQVRLLSELNDKNIYNVPIVLKKDPEIDLTGNFNFAWYKMPKYTLCSLLDLFSFTSGLEVYEVTSVVRTCFNHLHDTYWGWDQNLKAFQAPARTYISAPLSIAYHFVLKACNNIISHKQSIKEGLPVKLERSIDIYNYDILGSSTYIYETMNKDYIDEFEISVNWDGPINTEKCKNAAQQISLICDSLENITDDEDIDKMLMQAGKIHGDAHFGNFLLDASIPEDPFVVSIDPQIVNYYVDKNQLFEYVKNNRDEAMFDAEIVNIHQDPCYDIGKMCLSSSCCYGLAYRKAFVTESSDHKLELNRIDKEQINKLNNLGGISGSQIVNMEAPVTIDAWRYLAVSAKISIDEFLKLLTSILPNNERLNANINAALIRLWLFTVRHAFSISD